MAEDTLKIKGFSYPEAVWNFLRLKGLDESFTAFKDTYKFDGSPESMIIPLQDNGYQAGIAFVQIEEIPLLELPAMVQLQDQSWLLLLSRKGKMIRYRSPMGDAFLPAGQLYSTLTGQVVDLFPSYSENKSLYGRIKLLLYRYKSVLIQAVLASVILQLLALAIPELTGVVMNHALPDGAGSTLFLTATGVLLTAVFQAWTGWIRGRILLFLATRMEVSVERGFLEHLLRLPFPYLQKKTLGDMLQAFGGLAAGRELLVERAFGAMLDGSLMIVYTIVMAFKLPLPTLAVLIGVSVMAILSVIVGRAQAKTQALEVQAQAKEQGYLAELISGISTLKAAGAELEGHRAWMERFRREVNLNLKKNRIGLWSEVGLSTLQQTMTVILLIWGGKLCLDGKLLIGTLFSFLQLTNGFLGAVFGVVNAWILFAVLKPQLLKAREIFSEEPQKRYLHVVSNSDSLNDPIYMEDVWFRYSPEGPWVLKGYNLEVKPGEKFTLTGSSGSGKSTILRLLAGLYTPEKGTISIGGVNPLVAREKISYLPQFVRLYAGSIIENLRVLSCGAALESLMEAGQKTGLHEIVSTLPMNYHTILSYGGGNLSGGQRQLVAFTAVLASRKPLILVDEATANIDAIRSSSLLTLINNMPSTVVMASHVNVNETT